MERVGKYEIQSELGRGGFGVVYKAFDPTVGRVVAIKVLLPESTDAEFLGRFKMEATTTGNLHHPNLVTIHEFGEEAGFHYLVMEYLEGQDLQKIMRDRRPLTLLEKVEIMQQVASGLFCAHESGVVHRDVKPSNVMVMRDNMVKVMDFGIARLTRNDSTRFTRAGVLVGTLNFMAPEQFRDHEVDELCDIWAFGVIYYEFLTGIYPFQGNSTPAVLFNITSVEPPSPASIVPECPEALSQMIMRSIAKDRDLRYKSLHEFQLDARPILLDLRRKRADALIPEARALFEQQRVDEAQRLIRKILDLDPVHAEARELRERMQRIGQQQAVLPRIDSLKKSGSDQLSKGRYAEAIQSFENALRLDSANTEIRILLDQARNAVSKYREAQTMAESAAARAEAGDFAAAHSLVQQALNIDGTNQKAREVMARVQHAFDSEERRREAEQVVEQARGLMARQAFDEALQLLGDAKARLRDPADVVAAFEEASRRKEAIIDRERVRRALQEIPELLQQERVGEAEVILHRLNKERPDHEEVLAAIENVKQVRRVLERRDAVRRVAERTHSLHQDGELERALSLVRRAIVEFPGEAELTALEQETETLIRKRDERRAVDEALRQARDLRVAGDARGALRILDEARSRVGEVPAVRALAEEILSDLRSAEERQAARAAVDEVRALLARSDWQGASTRLREALSRFPGEPELMALSIRVERGLHEEEDRRQRDEAFAKAREARLSGNLRGASEQIQSIRARFGDWPALLDLEREIRSEQELREKRQAVGRIADEARDHITNARWEQARDLLQRGLATYPAEPELNALLQSVERGLAEQQSRGEREEALRQARALENDGRDTEALAWLDEAHKRFGGHPEIFSARAAMAMRVAERQRAGDISARIDRITRAIESNQFDIARRELDEARASFGDQPNLQRLAEELDLRRRLSELDTVARSIEQALERGQWQDAQNQLQRALAANPRDARLLRLQQTVESEAIFQEALQRVEQHLKDRRFDLAEPALRRASSINADDKRVVQLNQRLIKEREKAASERQQALNRAKDLTNRGSFDDAAGIIRGLLELNPSDNDAIRAQEELNTARAAHFMRQAYTARLNDLEQKRKADDPLSVKEGALIVLAEFPGDPHALSLLDWAERRIVELGLNIEAPPSMPFWKIGIAAAVGVVLATVLYIIFRPTPTVSWVATPDRLSFQWRLGEPLPDAKQIALSSARGVVKVSAKSEDAWLSIDPASASTPQAVNVGIAPQSMKDGDYKSVVELSSDAEPKSKRIAVSLKILPRVEPKKDQYLRTDTELLTFEVPQGAALSEAKFLRVSGAGVNRATASGDARSGWLRFSPSSTTVPGSIGVQVSAEGLNPGQYQGTVIVTSDGDGKVATRVPVSLRVRQQERYLSTDNELLTFEVTQGAASSETRNLRINGAGVPRVTIAASTSKGGNWLRLSANSSGVPGSVGVNAAAEGLAPGVYQGSITVSAENDARIADRVVVSLFVKAREERKVDPPKPPDPKPAPCVLIPVESYGGLQRGTITWVGELAPNQHLTIGKDETASIGKVNGRFFEGGVPVSITVSAPGVRVDSAPSQPDCYSKIVVTNTSNTVVKLISVSWRVQK